MKINYSSLSVAILLLFVLTGAARVPGLPDISEDRLHQHVFFLASDSLKGRGINSPGITKAAGYLKENLQEMNLAHPGSGYLQPFYLTSLEPDRKNSFIRVENKKKKILRHFIALNQLQDTVMVAGELIFAGFGPGNTTDDHTGSQPQELKGKIVLYSAGSPQSFREGTSQTWNNSLERKKMDVLFKSGAEALILVTSLQDTANSTFRHFETLSERQRFSLDGREKKETRKIYIVTPETADILTGRKLNWKKAIQAVSENKTPASSSIPHSHINIQSVQVRNKVETANVIGIVEGSDSLLKHECIVFMAHYDHLGTDKNGEIFNGADDNASGVASILELARSFAQMPDKPSRSIVFLFPSAEEVGLFGSDYYSRNPVFPMKSTIACINLDMVGRVYEPRDSVWAKSPKLVKDFDGIYALVNNSNPNLKRSAADACAQLDLVPDFSLPDRFFYSSDHYHFHKYAIPVLNFSTGYTADYHKATDTVCRIRTDKMKRIVQLCYLLGLELGNMD